jgi:hypothetical protein
MIGAHLNGNAKHINGRNQRTLRHLTANVNVGGELHEANGGRTHGVAAIIGGGRCGHSCSGRSTARSGRSGCGDCWRAKIFGAYAHDGTVALNLNLAKPGLM